MINSSGSGHCDPSELEARHKNFYRDKNVQCVETSRAKMPLHRVDGHDVKKYGP